MNVPLAARRKPLPDAWVVGGSGTDPAISAGGRTVSYAELSDLVDEFAGRLENPAPSPIELDGQDVVTSLATLFGAARRRVPVVVAGASLGPIPPFPPGAFLMVATSGTTGTDGSGRWVARTAESWSTSFRPLMQVSGLRRSDVVLLTGPLHTTLHLFGAVHALWLGAHLTDERGAATAVHAVPAVLSDLLIDPSTRLRTAVVAGAALPTRLADLAAERGVRLVEYYGAAELSFVAARVAPAPLAAFPGVEVRIVDGEIWAGSPYLALPPAAGTATAVRWSGGFATVGDLGSWTASGGLEVRGRGTGAVTTGGSTIIAADVEAVLSTLPGVAGVAVVGTPHDRLGEVVTAVLEVPGWSPGSGDHEDRTAGRALRAAARRQLSGPLLPRRWWIAACLPRTGGGKVAVGRVLAAVLGAEPASARRPASESASSEPADPHDRDAAATLAGPPWLLRRLP